MNVRSLGALLIFTSFSFPAFSNTVINFGVSDVRSSLQDERTLYVTNGQVRLVNSPGSIDPEIMYDAKTDEMTILDHQEKRFIKISEARIDAITGQVSNLLDGILGGLDIDTSSILGGSKSTIETKHSGLKRNIAGISCDMYDVNKDGQKVSELCFASYSNLKINPNDYETLNKMYQSGGKMAEKVRGIVGNAFGPIPDFNVTNQNGLPVYIRSLDSNNIEVSLQRFTEEPIDAQLFVIPSDYTETNLTSFMP